MPKTSILEDIAENSLKHSVHGVASGMLLLKVRGEKRSRGRNVLPSSE
jgi:hypothetical protein